MSKELPAEILQKLQSPPRYYFYDSLMDYWSVWCGGDYVEIFTSKGNRVARGQVGNSAIAPVQQVRVEEWIKTVVDNSDYLNL